MARVQTVATVLEAVLLSRLLGVTMKFFVHIAQVFVCNVRVDLGRADIAMPEH